MREPDPLVEGLLERLGVPGVGLGIVRDGEVVLARGFGVRDLTAREPVTPQTAFAIGSSTKAFTAALMGALVDDGLLQWDVPIREYLPWFRMHDPVASDAVTVRDLLAHRTGLPRHDLVWYGEPPISRADMVARMRYLPPNKGFRQTWQYNNLGYVTAGFLAGELLGGTWEEAVRKRLLEPLGMRSTTFSVVESRRSPDHALPHEEREGAVEAVPFRVIDRVGPAGSINATIEDMLAFITANTTDGLLGETRVISRATMREMHSAQMVLPINSMFDEVTEDAYGLGWFIGTYRGHRVVHHGGNIDGFTALMALLPEARAGVVVLVNRGLSSLPKALAYSIWDDVLGLEPIDWGERFHATMSSMREGARMAREHARARYAKDTTPSHPLSEYVGEYVHPGYGTFTFTLSDDGTALVPAYNGLDLSLRHRHYDVFELVIGGREEVRAPVVFATDAEGEIASASIQTESSVPPMVFERAPDARLTSPAFLVRAEGTYVNGPLTISVQRRGEDGLVLALPTMPPSELLPGLGSRFRLKDIPGATVEFVLDDDGIVRQVVIPGVGTFGPAS